MEVRKAIALMSGGLDSALAAKLMLEQGISVIGLHLVSPFGCRLPVDKVASHLGIRLIKREKGEAYLDLVKNPKFGYGKNMNPCIDCRIYMFQIADLVMQEEKADFVVTGEVLGQRPMSQMRHSMELIDSRTSLKGLLLRPLSAHHFDPTTPETKGWVDRSKLLGVHGRGRHEQIKLAEAIGVTEFAAPGGGCLLTESAFSNRLKDFYAHEGELSSEMRLARAELLHLGRHFRVGETFQFMIGRNQTENEQMARLWQKSGGHYFHPEGFMGPDAISFGTDSDVNVVGQSILRYANVDSTKTHSIRLESLQGSRVHEVSGRLEDAQLEAWRL